MSKYNYVNPSKKQDLSHLEASVDEEMDDHGFTKTFVFKVSCV